MKRVSVLLLLLIAAAAPAGLQAQTSVPEQDREAALFLERILRPWSIILSRWDRDPTPSEWAAARSHCSEPVSRIEQRPEGREIIDLPPLSERFGTLSFYRGEDGLQMIDWRTGAISMFSGLNAGRAPSGAPVYRLVGDDRSLVVALGKATSDAGPTIVMVFDGALYLSCRQPSSGR